MKTNNEPAFPLIGEFTTPQTNEFVKIVNCGMTLRDYFANTAMLAYIQDSKITGAYSIFAAHSYAMADAMLEERNK